MTGIAEYGLQGFESLRRRYNCAMINKWDPVDRRLLRERNRGRARATSPSSTRSIAAARDPRRSLLAFVQAIEESVGLHVWLQEQLKLVARGLSIPAALLEECEWHVPEPFDPYRTTSAGVLRSDERRPPERDERRNDDQQKDQAKDS
jgi:hypothetical protein